MKTIVDKCLPEPDMHMQAAIGGTFAYHTRHLILAAANDARGLRSASRGWHTATFRENGACTS
jgi:hypothetical protein